MPTVDDQRKLQTAFSQHRAGNVTAAANLYKDLITRDPQNYQAIHYLGVIEATSNLKKETVARGVSSERLIFAKRMQLVAEHLARHKLADLFLDTLPYNAHATASDALWAGLPVLTCIGETFSGTGAASLLKAIRLPELITTTLEAYEQMAIDLATNREKLAAVRNKLAENRLTTPLFDTKLFTKHIDAATPRCMSVIRLV